MSENDDDREEMRDPIRRRAMMERVMREGIGQEIPPDALDEWNAMMEWMLSVQNALDDAPETVFRAHFDRLNKMGEALCRDLGIEAPDPERRGRVIMALLAYEDDDGDDDDADAPTTPSGEVVPA